jgi:hypothetical protein
MFGGDSPIEEVVAVGTQNNFAAELAFKLRVAAAAGTSGQDTAGECYLLSCLSQCVSSVLWQCISGYSETSFAC